MVDSDPAFGQQLFNVSVRKSVAEIPADCHDDHVRREPESRERGPRRTYPTLATRHQLTLPSPSSLDATDPDPASDMSGDSRASVAAPTAKHHPLGRCCIGGS